MIVFHDPVTGWWNLVRTGAGTSLRILRTHTPQACEGRVCDIHSREDVPDKDYPLNWREDRGMMEVICPCGIGHPSYAQIGYWNQRRAEGKLSHRFVEGQLVHGCCGEHCPVGMTLQGPEEVEEPRNTSVGTDAFLDTVWEKYLRAAGTKGSGMPVEKKLEILYELVAEIPDLMNLVDNVYFRVVE